MLVLLLAVSSRQKIVSTLYCKKGPLNWGQSRSGEGGGGGGGGGGKKKQGGYMD